jgi:hypothetical protein
LVCFWLLRNDPKKEGEAMVFLSKKIYIILLSIIICSVQLQSEPIISKLSLAIGYTNFGYKLGVNPFEWPLIPYAAAGYFLPKENKTIAYLLGLAGVSAGFTVLGLAIYGGKKLWDNHLGGPVKSYLGQSSGGGSLKHDKK